MSDHLVALIAEEELALIFKTFSFNIYPLKDKSELKDRIESAVKQGCNIIFIQEDLLLGKEDYLELYKEHMYPIIIPLTTHMESPKLIKKMLKSSSIKAIGADIIGAN